MSKKIISISDRQQHTTNQIICVNCGFTGITVAPVTAPSFDLECPRCRELKCVKIFNMDEVTDE